MRHFHELTIFPAGINDMSMRPSPRSTTLNGACTSMTRRTRDE